MDTKIQSSKACGWPGRVLIPGDPEREAEADRLQNGIPLVNAVWQDLKDIGERFDIIFPSK